MVGVPRSVCDNSCAMNLCSRIPAIATVIARPPTICKPTHGKARCERTERQRVRTPSERIAHAPRPGSLHCEATK
eukprot:12616393-Alexandrium_andersonii.AAC.1